jgi:hypothetical protein
VNHIKVFGLMLAVLAAVVLSENIAKSQPGQVCAGKLVKGEDGGLEITDGEYVCLIDPSDAQKILAVCAEGHDCQVKGKVLACEDSGECVTIKNITSVKDLPAPLPRQ